MNDLDLSKPILLYGSNISYFTGKMENYFKIRGIPYKRLVSPYPSFEKKMKKYLNEGKNDKNHESETKIVEDELKKLGYI